MPKVIVVFPCPVGILISSFRFQLDWYASSSFEVLYIRMFMESWCSSNRSVHYWITRLCSICSSAMALPSCSSFFSDGTMWHPLHLHHMHLPVLLCMVGPEIFDGNHANQQCIDAGDSKYSF